MQIIRSFLAVAILAGLAQTALAQASQNKASQPPGERGAPPPSGPHLHEGERRGPPPEALAACKSLKMEAACSFKGRQGETVDRKSTRLNSSHT